MGTATLREQIASRQESAERNYRAAVALAAEDKFDLAKSMSIIEASGRSLDQFEADVETCRQRLQAVKDIASAENMAEAIQRALKADQEAAKKLDAIIEENRLRLEAARTAAWEASAAVTSLQDRKRALVTNGRQTLLTTADVEIDEEIDRTRSNIESAHYQLDRLQMQIQRAAVIDETNHERESEFVNGVLHVVGHPNVAASDERKRLLTQRDHLTASIATYEKRIVDLEASKMDPAKQRFVEIV